MRNLILCLIWFPLLAFAQKREVFRIESLPKEGVLLNQGWKWHAGDNPEWAKAEFDDSKWKFLPPLDLMDSLPQKLRPSGIRWFRLKLEFGKSLSKAILALAIDQVGASEIYMNGKLLKRYGVVSSNPDEVKAFNPLLDPIPFAVSKDSMVVLAVRYTYQNNIHKYLPSHPNLIGLTITVNNLEIIQSSKMLNLTRHYDSNIFRVGAFFILFISYFALYFYNPIHKANLFLCLFSLTILIADLIQLKYYNYHWTVESTFFITLFFFLLAVGKILMLTAVCFLMNQKINWLFGLLSGLILLSYFLFIVIGYHPVLIFLIVHIFPNLINLEIIRITLKAIQSQKKGAWIIALGGIVFLISVVVFVLSIYFNFIDTPLWGSVQTIGDLVYNVSWLSIPLAVAIYFGQEVALNNRSLKEKLTEVEQLSAEKQLLLSNQNETLERQVTERTAELSSKNRDLEIEAALERIRTRAMAMQNSDELSEAANLLSKEIRRLGIPIWSCGYNIMEKDGKSCLGWMSTEGTIQPSFRIPLKVSPTFIKFYESRQNGEELFEEQIGGTDLETHYNYMLTLDGFAEILKGFINSGHILPTFQVNTVVNFAQGNLIFISAEPVPEAHDIFKRFANVFEQTFTRFLDLQKAEALTREAQVEVALERIRSKTLSMQSSDKLSTIIGLIYSEMGKLNVQLQRCFFMIYNPENLGVTWWMASGESLDLGQGYFVQYSEHPTQLAYLKGWQERKEIWRYLMQGEEKALWDAFLFHKTELTRLPPFIIDNMKSFQSIYLDASFNSFGCLTTGNEQPLNNDALDLLIRFSNVFELTYTRFNDLKIAEAQTEQAKLDLIQIQTEKKRAEDALIELQSAQAQLIQSEKLASLGELTAGIAHEIQNPLNFVNNFAEVSAEMLDEMEEELDKGDTSEAKVLAADLKTNLKKINHHGQRASSIVKGMLEHSRTSTGVKEPTNINSLADEFLRLAYHGLRAKDSNNFNATMETHFDPDLPLVSVIPQDIGRVLLNLINNAFYATTEKAKQGIEGYAPTVTVSTRRLSASTERSRSAAEAENAIEISVQDNGNGIPDAIKDKIFQPFFTTKPTGQGTGLGLSLAYDIVTKGHGGTLELSTREGIETTITIRLPLRSYA